MINISKMAIAALLLSTLFACSESDQPSQEQGSAVQNDETTSSQAAVVLPPNQGQVVNHVNVPGYSYLEVENNGQRFWVAGNPVQFKQGDIVAWGQAAVMKNFHSKALDRTFDSILFVSDIYDPALQVKAVNDNRGKAVSVQNAAGYTYIEIERASGANLWLAVPETSVNVDDTVSWQDGAMMQNFTSKSLDRTFKEILFASAVTIESQPTD